MQAQATTLFTGRIYPGLRPFEAEDALLFFGREQQTDELLRRLEDTRFLAVVGLSGSGKSSLVRAGLLPALQRGHLTGAGSRWRISVMRPGADPLGALTEVLDETLGKRGDRLATLRSGSLGLVDTTRYGRDAHENLLLVIDQFEEIFRFQDANRLRAGEASEFVELLLAATQDYEPAYRVYVVLTLRSDYLGECARFHGLPEALNDSQYLVPRMTREQLRDAIEGPAALGGLDLSGDLLQELLDKTGDDPDQLPVLQHLLMRMWEVREQAAIRSRIGREHYQAVGGWDDALNRHADAVWNDLADRRSLSKRMFQRLTEKAQAGREVRRPATVIDLARVAEVPAGEVTKVVEHFREPGCNFLTSPDSTLTENSVIDISHESLIRRWKQLNEWTTEEADWGQWYRRVEDTLSFGGAWLVDPALEAALQARQNGHWNEAWAERYAKKDGETLAYNKVVGFLEESAKRRSQELARLRRTRAIVVVAALLFAVLAVAASWFGWSASRNAREALARQLASDSNLSQNANPDMTTAALLGVESLRQADTVQGYQALWASSGEIGREVARLAHQDAVSAVTFSPDGTLVATASDDKNARLFDVRTGRAIATLAHPAKVYVVAFSPDGTLLVTAADDNTARIFDVSTKHEVARLAHQGRVYTLAFSPDGTLLATGSADNTARMFQSRTGQEVARLAHQGAVSAVAFSPDGKLLATGSWDNAAHIFDVGTKREIARLPHQSRVSVVAFSPDGELLATGSEDNTARVFEVSSKHELARLTHQARVYAVAFSPDGSLVATASGDNTARVFEARTGRELARLTHQAALYAVSFSPDGALVVTGSADHTARLFEARTGIEVARLIHQAGVYAVAFSPDGKLVATGSADNAARIFEARTERQMARLAHQGQVYAVAFSRDGTLVATGSWDKIARVFEAATGRELSRLVHAASVYGVAFGPDAKLVATASGDKTARIFDVRTGREVIRLTHPSRVYAVAFSPDGTLVATGSLDGIVRVFDASSGREVAHWTHKGKVPAVAFSPDGRLVASGSEDKTAGVFEARTGREIARLAHQSAVNAVGFSPDGTMIVTGSDDKIARLSEALSGREIIRLQHETGVYTVSFSPDGRLVATGSNDNTARVFEVRTGREADRLLLGEPVLGVDFTSGGSLLRILSGTSSLSITQAPFHATDLITDACSKLNRNLTREEWNTYLGKVPYQESCRQLNPIAVAVPK